MAAIWFSGAVSQVLIAEQDAVVWRLPREVTAVDRKAILDIAHAVGIRQAGNVSVPIRSSCLLVEVESRAVLFGNRVVSTVLGIRQKLGPHCGSFSTDRPVKQFGNWIAFLGPMNPRQRERWRIYDGDWHVDVDLDRDVPYDDALMIVQAIRRKQLVDRRPPFQSSSPIEYIDASRIRSIRTGVDSPSIPRQYEIIEGEGRGRAGGGVWLTVRILEGRVELHSEAPWIS